MKYLIGLTVFTPTNDIVEIVDCEHICGVDLYYTSDKSAYPEDSLHLTPIIAQNRIDDICNQLVVVNKAQTYEEWKNDKIKEKSTNNTNNHTTSWMRKIISYLPKLRWGVHN